MTCHQFIADRLARTGRLTTHEIMKAGTTAGYEKHEIRAALALLRMQKKLAFTRDGNAHFYSIKEGAKS